VLPTAPTPPAAEQLASRAAAVWAALEPIVTAGRPLRVVDVGGGSGTAAVPLARLGHTVTVVDSSADALATLRRRADTEGVGERVTGLQGDADRLSEVLQGADPVDLVLCHSVLEVVDDPATTLRGIAGTLRPGGQVSIAVPNRAGAVLARALGGHPVEATALLEDRDPAPGRTRPARRRFSPEDLLSLVADAGLEPGEWRGTAVLTDLLHAEAGGDPDALRRLELTLSARSPYRDVAAGLHLLAARP
jgi:2-polyprenyl-3-methyl-5-hydroxy-6-metoxy-1,4-benzoquinol methylase